jgi:cardiolipin synthase
VDALHKSSLPGAAGAGTRAPVNGAKPAVVKPADAEATDPKRVHETIPSAPSMAPSTPTSLPPTPSFKADSTALDLRLGKATGKAFGGPKFEAYLDQATSSRAHAGTNIQMLFDGVNSFAERNRLIDGATSSIHLQTFVFNDDGAGWDLARRLAGKAKAGVEVRVIVDALGSNRAGKAIFEFMKEAGVDLRFYKTGLNPLKANSRWHEKHLIVDGKVSIEGGMNISDEYALGGSGKAVIKKNRKGTEAWRDTDARIEGGAVQDAQRAFLRNWKLVGGTVPEERMAALFPKARFDGNGGSVRVVQHHPVASADAPADENTMKLYLAAIGAATKSITIENAYFVPPRELREALIAAARRGVDVRIMSNSKESSDMGFVVEAARYCYNELLEAGVKIYEVSGGTLHAKTASFDGQYAIVGSANLNGRSKGLDTEVVLAIRDDKAAAQLDERFNNGIPRAKEITLADVEADSFVTNLKQWGLSTLSWTL